MCSKGPLKVQVAGDVPVIRKVVVQPTRNSEKLNEIEMRVYAGDPHEPQNSQPTEDEVIETCVIDGSEIHCAVNDDDSNIGSMISVHSEEVLNDESSTNFVHTEEILKHEDSMNSVHSEEVLNDESSVNSVHSEEVLNDESSVNSVHSEGVLNDEEQMVLVHSEEVVDDEGSVVSVQSGDVIDDDGEFIVPEVLPKKKQKEVPLPLSTETSQIPNYKSAPQSWPTLEILPGGVINLVDKTDFGINSADSEESESNLMYACAKCPQRFKYLFCLVKHVRWHEEEEKNEKYRKERAAKKPEWIVKKIEDLDKKGCENKKKIDWKAIKGANKVAILKPVKKIEYKTLVKDNYVCLRNGKITLVSKVKKPKKS